MASDILNSLDSKTLASLASSMRMGLLRHDISHESLKKTAPSLEPKVREELVDLVHSEGWQPQQVAYLLESLHSSNTNLDSFSHLFDLVLSGPKTEAVSTRDTLAVYNELIESAESEVLLASYAIYNGNEIFAPLIKKQESNQDFRTTIFLDIPRSRNDTTSSSQITAKYKNDFFTKQWVSEDRPDIYYLAASLESDWKARASMHAKIVIIDQKTVFLGSANLTRAAQTKNIEAGAIIPHSPTAERLADHFTGLVNQGVFKKL